MVVPEQLEDRPTEFFVRDPRVNGRYTLYTAFGFVATVIKISVVHIQCSL